MDKEKDAPSEEELIEKAAEVVLGTEGVSSLSGTFSDAISRQLPMLGGGVKGVKLQEEASGLTFDIYVNVDYGVKIPQLAWDIQSAVKDAIEGISEKPISAVNIHVQGVQLPLARKG
ncbi:MAG: Asp23/Gls24 family envelope stress response protein [Anaerovoracaceae bacterium]|jgi:uncharacterized alkaline shock family protein YloU